MVNSTALYDENMNSYETGVVLTRHYFYFCMLSILLFCLYNILPRGVKIQYFKAYPKMYARSSRYYSMKRRGSTNKITSSNNENGKYWDNVISNQRSVGHNSIGTFDDNSFLHHQESIAMTKSSGMVSQPPNPDQLDPHQQIHRRPPRQSSSNNNNMLTTIDSYHHNNNYQQPSSRHPDESIPPVAEVVVSATMQELRDPGLRLVAHGTKSKPRNIWLQLHQTMLIWQTESSKKKEQQISSTLGDGLASCHTTSGSPNKIVRGKEHQVNLVDILYVDVGKHTDALRKMENASLSEGVCFSLLTRRGSLDLQACSEVQRDALVSCFSLVLDEVHAKDWRKIYKGPTSEYQSSINAPSAAHMYEDLVNSEC